MKESKYVVLLFLMAFILGCKSKTREQEKSQSGSCIVSLVPSVTDILGEVCPDRVVAVSHYCDASFLSDRITRIPTFPQIKYEQLLEYKRCKIIVLEGFINSTQTKRMADLGLDLVTLKDKTINDILELPTLVDPVGGDLLSSKLRAEFNELLEKKVADEPTYLVMIGGGLQVYGHGNYLTELLDTVGFKNTAHNLTGSYPELKSEFFVENIPMYILSSDSSSVKSLLRAKFPGDAMEKSLKRIRHVQGHKNILFRPNHHFLECAKALLARHAGN